MCASDDALQVEYGCSSQLTRRYSFDIIILSLLLYIVWYVRGDMTTDSRPRREETMTSLVRTTVFFSVEMLITENRILPILRTERCPPYM